MSSTARAAKVKACNSETLLKGLKKFYRDLKTADILFEFGSIDDGSRTQIPAHKVLLAGASDVFKAMFFGPLKEKVNVQIDDADANDFDVFLRFFYDGYIRLNSENVIGVMYLGHKYNVSKCLECCVQFIKSRLSVDNVCSGLGAAILYDQHELKTLCERCISINSEAVFKSAEFLNCDQSVLKYILKMDLLSCTEVEVFEACMSWVKSISKHLILTRKIVNDYLGNAFYHVRFASMTIEDFAMLTHKFGSIFSADEYKEIIQLIAFPDTQPMMFSGLPRQREWNNSDVITYNRFRGPLVVVPFNMTETTSFSTNQPVLLGAFECLNILTLCDGKFSHQKSNLPVLVQVLEFPDSECAAPRILCKQKDNLWSKSNTTIWLNHPILIRTGFWYEIRMTHFSAGEYFYYTNFVRSALDINVDANFNIKFRSSCSSSSISWSPITTMDFNRI